MPCDENARDKKIVFHTVFQEKLIFRKNFPNRDRHFKNIVFGLLADRQVRINFSDHVLFELHSFAQYSIGEEKTQKIFRRKSWDIRNDLRVSSRKKANRKEISNLGWLKSSDWVSLLSNFYEVFRALVQQCNVSSSGGAKLCEISEINVFVLKRWEILFKEINKLGNFKKLKSKNLCGFPSIFIRRLNLQDS